MFADVTSANVVGYANTTVAEKGYFPVVPYFTSLVKEGQKVDIQDIQMGADVGNSGANIQIFDKDLAHARTYNWFKNNKGLAGPSKDAAQPVPEGKNGLWFKAVLTESGATTGTYVWDANATLDYGESVMLFVGTDGKTFTVSGAVQNTKGEDAGVFTLTTTDKGYYPLGNPFASQIDLQDIQMDANVGNSGANIQIFDKDFAHLATYNWFKNNKGLAGPSKDAAQPVPEGKNGLWFKAILTESGATTGTYEWDGTKKFSAGDGFQLFVGTDNRTVTITCPYSL